MWSQAALLLLANRADQSRDLVVAHVDVSLGSSARVTARMGSRNPTWRITPLSK